ncbi:MAG: hypothetical protein AB9861_03635 [Methanosarcina sp.]
MAPELDTNMKIEIREFSLIFDVYENRTSILKILAPLNIEAINNMGDKRIKKIEYIEIALLELIENNNSMKMKSLFDQLLKAHMLNENDRNKFNQFINKFGFHIQNREVTLTRKLPIDPEMESDLYQKILNNITNFAEGLENHVSHYYKDDEEKIRGMFLASLNNLNNCLPTGETFNKSGKTDILVHYGKDVVFVAECKIWGGEQKLYEAVDQLFGYTTRRNNKTALIIFNRNEGFTTTSEKMYSFLKDHKHCMSQNKISSNCYEFTFNHPDDDRREFILTAMIFDFYMHT